MDGTKQAIWFPLSAVLAFAISALFGALNLRVFKTAVGPAERLGLDEEDAGGLTGLARRSYFSNLPVSWRLFTSEVGEIWRTGLASADRWSVFRVFFGRSGE